MNNTRTGGLACAVAFLALLTSACGSESRGGGAAEPPIGTPQHITAASQLDYPMAHEAPNGADQLAISRAIGLLTQSCMRRFGAGYTLPVEPSTPLPVVYEPRRFGIIDAAEVAEYGYRSAPDPVSGSKRHFTKRAAEVLNGIDARERPSTLTAPGTGEPVPRGGCSTEAYTRVLSGDPSFSIVTVSSEVMSAALDDTMADSRVAAVAAQWATCMSQWGYTFAGRADAGNSVRTSPLHMQLEMAERDLTCAQHVNYVGICLAVDRAYELREMAARQDELRDADRKWHQDVARAHAIIRQLG